MVLKKTLVTLLVQLTLVSIVFGQPELDSLKKLFYSPALSPAEKSLISAEIAELFLHIDFDSAKYYSQSGLELAERNRLPKAIFKNSCALGKVSLASDSLARAIVIFENARKYFEILEDKRDALCIFLLLGYVYDIRQEYFKAHEVLYSGLTIAEETRDSAFLWSYFNNIGNHYIGIEDYENSIVQFKRAITVYNTLSEDQKRFSLASTYNNLGVAYLRMDLLDSADIYFRKALSIPDVKGNYFGLHDLTNNLGEVSFRKGDVNAALQHFLLAGAYLDSLGKQFEGSSASLFALHYCNLGKVYFDQKDLSKAENYFIKSLEFSKLLNDFSIQSDAFFGLASIYEQKKDFDRSLAYLRNYIEAKDSLESRITDEKIIRVSLQYEYEKDISAKMQKIQLLEIRNHRKELIYIFVIVTVVGVLVSVFLLYLLQRNKIRRKHLEEKAIRLEKERISEELDYKNKELTTNVLYLLKKNEFIASISQKLNEILNKFPEEDTRILKGIIMELDRTAEDDSWDEFELRFKEVHTDFYNRLSRQFPGMTAQDLRLCAFLRLNMTSKEIAAITYQSTDSLKTARYRLRKKLGIDRDENLISFLTRI